MIYLSDVRDWLKSFEIAEHYYIGKLDNKPDKAFGVYSIKQSGAPVQAIGQEMSYRELAVSVLIHWNNNADSTDKVAWQLFEQLRTIKNLQINGHAVYILEMLVPEPVDVGTDKKGIYERVIDFKLYYERK